MTTLIVPGLLDSGPDHWQSWFATQIPDCRRVEQDNWTDPDLENWSYRVRRAIRRADRPVFIVAHSFGCLAAVHAGAVRNTEIAGALLVAPADPALFGNEHRVPATPLPFPAIVVASQNDEWMPAALAKLWAHRWSAHFVNIGHAGHINVKAGFGPWPQGMELFRRLQWISKKNARNADWAARQRGNGSNDPLALSTLHLIRDIEYR